MALKDILLKYFSKKKGLEIVLSQDEMRYNGLNSWNWVFESCEHAQSRGKFFYLP